MIGVIIKYSRFYQRKIPKTPLKLIEHLPKAEIILTFAKINTLLQPQGYGNVDDSLETQFECLKAILLPDEKNKNSEYRRRFDQYKQYIKTFKDDRIFTRGTCLYGLNEILQSDNFLKELKTQYVFEERIGILNYLLVCNERILEFSSKEPLLDFKKKNINFFEFFAFNQIPYNQYNIPVNNLAKLYKSSFFLKSLMQNDYTKELLENYFHTKYGLDDVKEFFRIFMYSFLNIYDENLKIYHLQVPNDQKGVINILNGFCSDTPIRSDQELNHSDVKTLDFLSVKKTPIYSWGSISSNNHTGFVVLDLAFLLEKMDSLLINDFWFDFLKKQSKWNRTDWGNFIGSKFFEPLVADIFYNALINQSDFELKMMDELKIKLPSKSEIEITDIYVRNKQKIALFEVKSNFINMVDGYKSITTIEEFQALDIEKFYKIFGLKQMVQTIKKFHFYKQYLGDLELNLNRKVHLYPIILVNEPILSCGLFNYPLRQKFESMLMEENINMKSKEHLIWPLIIMNIEDLQELEQSLSDNETNIFKIFDSFHSKTSDINIFRNNNEYFTFMSIRDIISSKIRSEKLFPKRLKDYKWTFAK